MTRTWKVTNTNVRISAKIMKDFKQVISEQGYRLQKGFEVALIDHIKKHSSESPKNKDILKAMS